MTIRAVRWWYDGVAQHLITCMYRDFNIAYVGGKTV